MAIPFIPLTLLSIAKTKDLFNGGFESKKTAQTFLPRQSGSAGTI